VYAGWLRGLGKLRKQLFANPLDPDQRRALLHAAASRASFEAQTACEPLARESRS